MTDSNDDLKETLDPLTLQPMIKLAQAIRSRAPRIVARWDHLVKALLPDADGLTARQVRNSIPLILEQMARALEADDPRPTEQLIEITKSHGSVRFHDSYNMRELIEEYRILRRILIEEIDAALAGAVTAREWMALDMAVDIALQQAVLSFLESQTAQLSRANEAEAKYLSFLAHDLRNDLNAIMLTMQWVEQSLSADATWSQQVAAMRRARGSVEQTMGTMERLLHAERLRKGVAVQREPVLLRRVADTVLTAYETAAEAKGLRLENAIDNDAIVHTDLGLLTVILQNLVGNAIKYSDRGTIRFHADPMPDLSGWVVHLSDQGKGIAPEVQKQLFEAFRRGETHGQAGVGLGLYIAAQGAAALGGALTLESKVGDGTTFHLALPEPRTA